MINNANLTNIHSISFSVVQKRSLRDTYKIIAG